MICVPSDDSHIIMTFRLVPLPTLGHFMRVLTKCFRSFFPAIIKLIKHLSLGRSLYFINKIRHNFCCKTNKNLLNTKQQYILKPGIAMEIADQFCFHRIFVKRQLTYINLKSIQGELFVFCRRLIFLYVVKICQIWFKIKNVFSTRCPALLRT